MNIQIKEVLRRYHLSETESHQKARLNLLTEQLFREYIDLALISNGLSDKDIVCIRTWHVPIVFDPNKTDIEVFQSWLAKLDATLKQLFAQPDPSNWIRYSSEIDVLTSIPIMLASRQLDDVWAWQQMGIVRDDNMDFDSAKSDWLAYLERNPTTLKAVFIALAVDGRVKMLFQHQFLDFYDAVRLIDKILEFKPDWSLLLSQVNIQCTGNWPTLLAQVSLNQLSQNNSISGSQALVGETWLVFYSMLKSSSGHKNDATKAINTKPIDDIKCLVFSALLSDWVKSGYRLEITNNAKLISFAVMRIEQVTTALSRFTEPAPMSANSNSSSHNEDLQSQDEAVDLLFTDIPIISQLSPTNVLLLSEFAGLLYIINLLKRPVWQAQLVALLEHGDSPSVLLRALAKRLLRSVSDDPVIDVFSGEITQIQKDNKVSDPLNQKQIDALDDFVQQLKQEIIHMLGDRTPRNEQQILDWLCRRKARIDYQPGWVNVTFELDSIDTQVRAAGLDLNPDYVPWLGYVVKFYYE
ncbi:hypothetical protein [Aliiglaciecola lipolytica]|uniref:Uncharacterized protein n=1 Tax=Aliiglaciecola lipolytica E3 TaxID=1127673 RepID=K6Y8Q3_9ALTE|nr:hypothetical protein [Aliiglaciecola lipolytica]GAC13038.1 hypothetical protein GLIP_0391 [Aliiglaciecola lipolytica E3]